MTRATIPRRSRRRSRSRSTPSSVVSRRRRGRPAATSGSGWRSRWTLRSPTWATSRRRSTRSSAPSPSTCRSQAPWTRRPSRSTHSGVSPRSSARRQGQGHQTVVSQIVADELGLTPEEITVVDEMDTFTRVWSISSGTYSSRFGSVGTSAVVLAARKLKGKLVEYAAHLMARPAAEVEFRDGAVRPRRGTGPSYSVKDLAGRAHWNTESLPEGMEPGLQATAVFGFTVSKAVDAEDRVNSSNTYGFIAEVMA